MEGELTSARFMPNHVNHVSTHNPSIKSPVSSVTARWFGCGLLKPVQYTMIERFEQMTWMAWYSGIGVSDRSHRTSPQQGIKSRGAGERADEPCPVFTL